ncbi:SRPBCC family protein [Noviherbaspirillum denitrificans]|nr:SRPBCC family protein [Noviherbaspirillum denitrificans]
MKLNKVLSLVLSCASLLAAGTAVGAETRPANVTVEHRFDVSADIAWKTLGRFCAISDWQSLVASCVLDERKDGIYRTLVMNDGSAFVERLEEYSAAGRTFAYTIKSGPLPVQDYRSEFRLVPDGAQGTRLLWKAWYTVPAGGDSQAIAAGLQALFANGLNGMQALLASAR